jgi:ribosomal protein L11 methyltransferase
LAVESCFEDDCWQRFRVFTQTDHWPCEALPGATVVCTPKLEGPIAPEDWETAWKAHWHVTPIGQRLVICPTWEAQTYTPAPHEIVLYLDPGAAFGTGAHETTRLMLEALETLSETLDFSQHSVLDVGTGSGILAIAAARLGCRHVVAMDTDPSVLPVVMDNAQQNAVAASIDTSDTPLEDRCHTRFDVLLGNLYTPTILHLLPEMSCRLAPGGHLLLSGILVGDVAQVQAAAEAHGLMLQASHNANKWAGLHFTSCDASPRTKHQ